MVLCEGLIKHKNLCLCVCVFVRGSERERGRKREIYSYSYILLLGTSPSILAPGICAREIPTAFTEATDAFPRLDQHCAHEE